MPRQRDTYLGKYSFIPASTATSTALGAGGGATGDYLERAVLLPTSTSPGAVTLFDGSFSMVVFAGGASSIGDLKPIPLNLGIRSQSGAFKVLTGVSIAAIFAGRLS